MNRFLPSLLFVFALLLSCSTVYAQWQRQYPLEKLDNVLDIAIQPDGYGFAVGVNDLVLKLNPGTQTWDLLTNLDKQWTLKAVDYLNGTAGAIVAAGGQGLILSTNGGLNWDEVPNAPAGIVAIQLMSSTQMIVVTDGGVFSWENDTWTDLGLPITSSVRSGFILDSDHIWAYSLGANPAIYSTSDGGNNWSTNTEINSADVVRFYTSQYGVALDGRKVYHSFDGGNSWTLISSNVIHNTSADFTFGSDANVMIAATNNGLPTITQDSGKTWTKYDMGTINDKNYSVAAVSNEMFWVGNDISSITLTTDGGVTWEETSGPKRNVLFDTYFINRNTGFSVGASGTLLRSLDGGTNWEELGFLPNRNCLSIFGLTEDDIWMGVNLGIFHSSDMGETWTEKLTLLGGTVNDILALSASHILAVTGTGVILNSMDSGTTWDTVYQSNNSLRSIAKIDGQRFMATGFNGLILKSIDQGATWSEITPPEAGLQYEETQFIGEEGWMVSSSFKNIMWYSDNAGDTWSSISLPIDRSWYGLYFISPDTGVVVGGTSAEGRVYITFNGGQSWQGGHITSYPIYGATGLPNPNGTAWIYGFGSDIEVLPYCNTFPVINDFVGDQFPCEGDTLPYTVTSQDVSQFHWLFPTGWQIIGDGNNDSVLVKVGRNPGTISVTGSNPCGISGTINVSAGPFLLPVVSNLSGDQSPCQNSEVTYSVTGTDVDQYVWSFPAGWNVVSDPTQASVMVEVGAMSGQVSVQASNLCGTSVQLAQAVNATLAAVINTISGDLTPCEGSTVTYTAEESNSDTFIWTFPAGWEIVSQNGTTIQVKAGALSGGIIVTGQNACGNSAPFVLDINPKPAPAASIIQNGNNLSLSQSGSTYQWYLDGEVIVAANSSEYIASVSGAYYATIVYANGCAVSTDPVNVIVSSIWDADAILSLSTYPNPVKEELYLQGIEGDFQYKILDFSGKVAINSKSAEQSIKVSSLSEGIYVIRIQQGDKTYQARFVIMR